MPEPAISDRLREILSVFETADPGEPLTTSEVVETISESYRQAQEGLSQLDDSGFLDSKRIGSSDRIWWLSRGADGPGDRDLPTADQRGSGQSAADSSPKPTASQQGRSDDAVPMPERSDVDSLSNLFDKVEVGMFLLDADFNVVWANSAIGRYFGIDRERVLGQDKRDLVATEIAPSVQNEDRFRELVLSTYQNNTNARDFECLVSADGERAERWLEHRSRPIEDGPYAGGRIELYYDVTAQKRSQKAHQKEQTQLQTLIDAVEEYAIFRLDAEGHVRSWNSGAEQIKGYEASEIVGEHISKFYTDADREAGVPEENLRIAAETGSTEDEGWRLRKDGSQFWATATITAVHDDDGELTGYVKVTRDMTERRERVRELQEEKAFTDSILNHQRDILYALDTDKRFLRWNDRLGEVTGYDDETIEEMRPQDFVPDEDVDALEDAIQQVLDGESTIIEVSVLTSDGETMPYEFSGTPLTDEDGSVIGLTGIARDIRDRKEKERRLQRQRDELERELNNVFSRIDDAFFGLDDQFRFTYLNDSAEDLFDQSEEALLGAVVWEAFPEIRETELFDALHEAMDTQSQSPIEFYLQPLELWVRASIYPSEDGLSVSLRDVTDRKEREQQLVQYEQIVETVNDGIYAVNADGNFIMVNAAFCSMTGYSRSELLGAHATTVHGDEITPLSESLSQEIADGTRDIANIELDIHTKHGETIPCESRVAQYPIQNEASGRCGVIRDISEREARERELAQFKEAVEASGHAICMFDTNGSVTYINSAFEAITGYDETEAKGKSFSLLGSARGDSYHQELWDVISAGDVWENEVIERRKNGELYYAEQTIAPVRNEDGSITQYIAVQRDITDRKQFEKQLTGLNEMSKRLLTVETADDVSRTAMDTVADLFQGAEGVIYRYDQSSEQLHPTATTIESPSGDAELPSIPADDTTFTGTVYVDGATRYCEDVTDWSESETQAPFSEFRTCVFMPLGRFGVLILGAPDVDAFDTDRQQLMELLAATTEAALSKVAHEQELGRRITQQEVVTELGQHALEDRDIDSLMEAAAEKLAATLDTTHCQILQCSDDGQSLVLRHTVGLDDVVVDETTVSATDSDSQAAYTLARDQPVVVTDLATETRFTGWDLLTDHDIQSGITVTIGPENDPWGILGIYDTKPQSFSHRDVTVVRSVVNILTSAIQRHRDEQELVRQREQLAVLNSLNDIVRDISDAVISQSSREEIEHVVCDRLVESTAYEFAWIGKVDHRSQEVTVQAEAGVGNYLEDITISVNSDDDHSEGPTGRAFRTGKLQRCQDIRNDDTYDQWRDEAEAYGYRSSAAIPIVHDGTTYGVLNIYATRTDAFGGREGAILEQLGEVVGHAIAAVERKRALLSDEVVELGFHVTGLFSLLDIEESAGTVTFDEAVSISEDEFIMFGTAAENAVPALRSLAEHIHWDSITFRDADETAETRDFEIHLSDSPLLSTITAVGGTIADAGIEDGTYHMTVQLPPGDGVRTVIDAVTETFPSAQMVTRQQTERETRVSPSMSYELSESMTDRQKAALQAAYYAGFFEWPRDVTGQEVADSLQVSAPTFHQHLRKAEK